MNELLAELQDSIKQSERDMRNLDQKIKSTKKSMNIKEKEEPQNFDHVLKSGPTISFAKSQRFKQKNIDDSSDNISMYSCSTAASFDITTKKLPVTLFAKTERFKYQVKEDYQSIEPNYDYIKRTPQSTVIKKPTKKVKQDSDTQSKTNDQLGPGAYNVQFKAIQTEKNVKFSKDQRFEKTKEIDYDAPLYPNYDAIKYKQPITVIKEEVPRNEKLKLQDQKKKLMDLKRIEQYLKMPLEMDKFRKPNVPVYKYYKSYENYDLMTDKQRLARMWLLIHQYKKTQQQQRLGPGIHYIEQKAKVRCMVVYKSHSPKKVVRPEKRPGPAYYYAQDDMVHERVPFYTFSKGERIKKVKRKDLDLRKPLYIDLKQVKRRWPAALIFSGRKEKKLRREDMYQLRLGPGFYNQNHGLIEPRDDKGNLKYQEVNEKNDRIANLCDLNKRDNYDYEDINPNYDHDKPGLKGAVKLHDPIEHKPQHPPNDLLYEDKWRFYDFDLDNLRWQANQPTDFARGLNIEEYKEHERDVMYFKKYMDKGRKMPEQYDVKYDQIDKKVEITDLKKQLEKHNLDPIQKEDEQRLILDPQKPKPRLPDIIFKNKIGREEHKIEEDNGQLVIEVNENQTRIKVKSLVNIAKQPERPLYVKDNKDDQVVAELNPNPAYLDKKRVVDMYFDKQVPRDKPPKEQEDVVITNPKHDLILKKEPVFVNMGKGSKRFTEQKKEVTDPDTLKQQTDAVVDIHKAIDSLKPSSTTPGFKGPGRDPVKVKRPGDDLIEQRQADQLKQQLEKKKDDEKKQKDKNKDNIQKKNPDDLGPWNNKDMSLLSSLNGF